MIEVKTRRDGDQTYVLCRSEQRIPKDRAIRTRQEVRLRADIDSLAKRIAQRRLVKPAKINQAIGRLKDLITNTADRICYRIANKGSASNTDVNGTLNVELNGLASLLAGTGVKGTASP